MPTAVDRLDPSVPTPRRPPLERSRSAGNSSYLFASYIPRSFYSAHQPEHPHRRKEEPARSVVGKKDAGDVPVQIDEVDGEAKITKSCESVAMESSITGSESNRPPGDGEQPPIANGSSEELASSSDRFETGDPVAGGEVTVVHYDDDGLRDDCGGGGREEDSIGRRQVLDDEELLAESRLTQPEESRGDRCSGTDDGLPENADVPGHAADLHGASSLGISCPQLHSLLANLRFELDCAKSNLLLEVERRREAENSLACIQKQWKCMVSYLLLDRFTVAPLPDMEDKNPRDDPLREVSQDIIVAQNVSEAFKRCVSSAKRVASMELLMESKNHEIAQLQDELKHYEFINKEMIQKNQELEVISRKKKKMRKRKQKLIWTCVGFSVTIGVSLVASSFILPAMSRVPASSLSPDKS